MDDNYAGYDEQELVAVIPSQQNWKGIGISLVVILSVIGLVALSVWFMTPENTGPRISGLRMQLSNLTSGMFEPSHYNCTWYSAEDLAFISADSLGLVIINTHTKQTKSLVSANIFKTLNSFSYSLSPDRVWILVRHAELSSYYGSSAQYSIQNIQTELNSPVMKVGVESLDAWATQERLQHVEWVGSTGGSVVIVKDNDIYYKPTPENNNKIIRHHQRYTTYNTGCYDRITRTGVQGVVFNGITDWTYKERILRSDSALWMSPGGGHLVYLSINCSGLQEVRYPRLLGSHEAGLDQVFIKYPMAGRNISHVKVYLYDFKLNKNMEIKPPEFLKTKNYYVENVAWVDSTTWTITWLTREQDFRIVSLCKTSGACSQNLNSDGIKGPQIVTHGAWRVKQLLDWDQNYIYFTGTAGDQDSTQHLYRYQPSNSPTDDLAYLNNSLAEHTVNGVTCITCATPCQNSKPVLSSDNALFVQQCMGPGIPFTQVCSTSNGECFLHLENNTELQKTVQEFAMAQTKFIMVEISPGRLINVELRLPAGFREKEEFAFPMIVHIDSLFPRIDLNWKVTWMDYLSSNKDYIIAKIDIPNMERKNESVLGNEAHQEIIQVMRYLSEELHYVDKTKVALVGEDEGGYTAGMVYLADIEAAGSEPTLTKCVVYVSPTVNWKLTDAFRSENLLGPRSQQFNWNRYELSSLTAKSLGYPGQSLYLTNRPGDLVNLHHLFQLSRKLVLEGTVFKQQVYIDDGQDINSWLHFYKSLSAHLESCLGPVEDYYRDDYFLASISML